MQGIKQRQGAIVAAYLILRQGERVLLSLRQNTGYMDGYYGLVSGHVEDGESATEGMIREAKEEAGIILTPSQVKVVHIMHRQTDRFGVDVFFTASEWEGTLENREPDKCAELKFFRLDAFPSNMKEYIVRAITLASQGQFYSELGWEK